MATGALTWIGGLHLGVPGPMVENPPSQAPLEAAAFISGLDVRRVTPSASRYWPKKMIAHWAAPLLARVGLDSRLVERPPANLVSVLSSLSADTPEEGTTHGAETSLRQDGLWLYAACMHGDYFGE